MRLLAYAFRALRPRGSTPLRTGVAIGSACALAGLLLSLAWPLPDAADPASGGTSTALLDREGRLLRTVQPSGGQPVALDAVAPVVVDALVATEDRRFWAHPGIDPLAMAHAAWTNARQGRVVRGASTITMQVAEQLRQTGSSASGARGPFARWTDKLAEMHLALRLELRWSKRRILAAWLNRVPFGNQARGIEAAAKRYFGKAARDLTTSEAALLVGLPQSPSRYDPFRHPEQARQRRAAVLRAMQRAGHLTAAERERLSALPLGLDAPHSAFHAPHFTTAIRQDTTLAPRLHATARPLAAVHTTLDRDLQRTVEGIIQSRLHTLASESVTNAAALVLDNATGAVRAYVGSADFWNAQIGGQNDGVRMRRQPGSTLKPFTYARALASHRYTPASILADIELSIPGGGGAFVPTNYDDTYHGPVPLREALASSYNVPAVRLAREMGPAALLRTLRDAGFHSLDQPPSHYGLGLALGNGGVQLLELARAYAGLARSGTRPVVHSVARMQTTTGDTIRPALPAPAPMPVTGPVASLITDILSDDDARAPAFGHGGPLAFSFPVAAKTGTSKDYRDNWTVGYTPEHTVAVWVGNFDGAPMRRVSGISGAGPIFHAIAQHLGPGGAFKPHPALRTASVCPASGQRPGAHCPAPRRERFLPGTVPTDTCTVHRRIPIDTRTGQRATAQTPARHVAPRRFTVHPERYHDWMRRRGQPLPPPRRSASGATQPPASAGASEPRGHASGETLDAIAVQHPRDGAQFHLDPVLRRTYQRAALRGRVPSDWTDVHWQVGDRRLDGNPVRWRLRPGRHTLRLRATRPDGTPAASDPITVVVHDVPEEPAWPQTSSDR
jgi:penicillin-binding protein 1C